MGMERREGKPVDLRHNRESDLIFPDGLPPGAVITISSEPERRGKRLRIRFPALAKIVHRKVDKTPEIPTIE